MRNIFYHWRFYRLGREQYSECMNRVFSNNLLYLRQANTVFAIFAVVFSLFPLLLEKDVIKMCVYLAIAIVAFVLAYITNYTMQKADVKDKDIYTLITIFSLNLIFFGIYQSVLANPYHLASLYYCLLISLLLLFVNSPIYNFFLITGTVIVFIVSTVIVKAPDIYIFDIINVLVAGLISLYFSWQVSKLRLGLEFNAGQLEEERNKYLNQSIVDELTQLRNRRDYMNTFHRFLTNYRASDDWFCVAIGDIDFFKNYNDFYGHPKGDDCLRVMGGILNHLKEIMGVYTARVGGEEFSMLWCEKDLAHVDAIINKLIKLIREARMPHEKSKVSQYVTMSIGVYIVKCGSSSDVQTLYDFADKALYTAKGSGRNCAIIYGEEIKQYKIPSPFDD